MNMIMSGCVLRGTLIWLLAAARGRRLLINWTDGQPWWYQHHSTNSRSATRIWGTAYARAFNTTFLGQSDLTRRLQVIVSATMITDSFGESSQRPPPRAPPTPAARL